MIPKIIMVPFSGKDTELGALEMAAELAKKYRAHIDVWHITPDPNEVMDVFAAGAGLSAGYVPVAYLKEAEKKNQASMLLARKKFHRFLRVMQISQRETLKTPAGPTATFHAETGLPHFVSSVKARLADIVIISRAYRVGGITSKDVSTNVLSEAARPVLVVPAGKHAKGLNEKAIIAWNGSPQATRAVTAALPLIAGGQAQAVSVVEGTHKFAVSPHELSNYLTCHGVKAKPFLVRKKSGSTSAFLLGTARKYDAGLIVMGAYTHSRARELILGGVTDHMLDKATIPVFFAH